MLLRRVPDTRLVLPVASGVMLPAFAHHPLTLIRRDPVDQRRVAEFPQVITQMAFPRRFGVNVRLSFASLATATELSLESRNGRLMSAIFVRARCLLRDHRAFWYGRGSASLVSSSINASRVAPGTAG